MMGEKKDYSMKTDNMIRVSEKGKIKVYWNDRPENYSNLNKTNIRNAFADKYNVPKESVKVVYRPVKIAENGDVIRMEGVGLENVGDIGYQRKLFAEWVKRENIDVDIEEIYKLDDLINSETNINPQQTIKKKWGFKNIIIDNLLSYGDGNRFDIGSMNGLITVTSTPANMGGKTTLIIDAPKFLLFGTTSKAEKNEQVFNRYRDCDVVNVRGLMWTEGEDDIMIERKLTRKKKKTGEWTVSGKVNYYKVLPDGTEESLNDEDSTKTTAQIANTVGTSDDFDLVSLATGDNLASLIHMTSGESGKIFTRFIGLEIMEVKESLARKRYNAFAAKMKSKVYQKSDLENSITELNENIKESLIKVTESELAVGKVNSTIETLTSAKDSLLSSKKQVDPKLMMKNPDTLSTAIETIKTDGIKLKADKETVLETIKTFGDISYDELGEKRLNDRINELQADTTLKRRNIIKLEAEVKSLKDSGICPCCKRALDNVDHTSRLDEITKEIESENTAITKNNETVSTLTIEVNGFKEIKEKLNKKQRLELESDRMDVKLDELRLKLKESMNDLKDYEANKESIQFNKELEVKINDANAKISVEQYSRDLLMKTVSDTKNLILNYENKILENTEIIKLIDKEAEEEKIYKVYIDMVGKKGISKIVLRSVLPILNAELERLLDGVCDFDIEIDLDEKNDINLFIVKKGVYGPLKSASGFERTVSGVALRCVLGIVSTLPSPDFIAFDEVLDKVAKENLEKMRPIFEKVKDLYGKVFIITHEDSAKDWGEKLITITKDKDEISSIDCK